MEQGQKRDLTVEFISSSNLKNVNTSVVPNLKPFVTLEPTSYKIINANTIYKLNLHFFVPYNTKKGTYDGTITLRTGSKTCSQPLKVVLKVGSGQNTPPVANAGPDQTVYVTNTVTLDGSGSSDVDGDLLTFKWSFVSVPNGSAATLSDPTAVNPAFVVDRSGTYVVQLIVNDGKVDSAPDTVSITTENSPPVANAGLDQTVYVTNTVTLDGSGSSDVDGDLLTFKWSFVSIPEGSAATLSDPTAVNPIFVVDRPGTYIVQLIVNDGTVDSAPDTVSITTENSPPVANAGPDQTVYVTDTVTLDGSGSSDVDGDALTFKWSFVSVPDGSAATLSDPSTVNPAFVVDRPGTYVVQLIVNDGAVDSAPDTVSINTTNSRPVADAGDDQSQPVGSTITLDGSGSYDVDNDPLSYFWSFTSIPNNSTAVIIDPNAINPTFWADLYGTYVAQLIVNDGNLDSTPDTVVINATDSIKPTITITSPVDGAFLNTTKPNIMITFNDADSGINLSSFTVSINGIDSTAFFNVISTGAEYQVVTDLPAGNNSITASISDNAGNTASATSNFRIGILRAIPGANPTSGVAPLTVHFTTNGEDPHGTIQVFRWDFNGDGIWDTYDSVARDYDYTYNAAGAYNATLFVQSSTGATASATITITVQNPPPVATADVIPSNGPVPLNVQFLGTGTSPGGSIVLYEWDFNGDGTIDWSSTTTGNTPHTYNNVGTYQAVFRVTDNMGQTATALALTTVVNAGPPGSPTVTATATPVSGPAPLTVNFNGTATDPNNDIVSYEWDFNGDGIYDWSSPSGANTTHTYSTPGMFAAYLRVTDSTGLTGIDIIVISVGLTVDLSIGDPDFTFNPENGEVIPIKVNMNASVPASIIIENEVREEIQNIPVLLDITPPAYFNDFESGTGGGWTHGGSNDLWQLGTPTSGPGAAHSGIKCWATNLSGNYVDYMNCWLLSPPIPINEPTLSLSFYHYFYSESCCDYGYVEITTDGTNFSTLKTYIGNLGGYKKEEIPLSSYVGHTVQVRFRFYSDYSVVYPGWYIDDVAVQKGSSIVWDGRDSEGYIVNDGVYYAILKYYYGGVWNYYDLTDTTGGSRSTGFRQSTGGSEGSPATFSPFNDQFLPVTFTLNQAAEVTLFIGYLWGTDTRIRTITNRVPFPAGTNTVYWDGLDDNEEIATAPPGWYLVPGAWSYTLPDNAMFVTGGKPVIGSINGDPNYFSPFSEKCDSNGRDEGIVLTYNVSENVSSVELQVYSLKTGSLVRTSVQHNIIAGTNTLFWDGKNNNGEYVDIGDYQVGVIATDGSGNSSMLRYTLVRIDY
jgi:PKD repeat protein